MTETESNDGNVVAAPMPRTRFEALIATYGAGPERWPKAERAAARALVERNAEARDARAEAALLDRVLDTGEAPAPSEDLVRELRRRFDNRRFRLAWRAPAARWMSRPGAALAGAAALVLVALGLGRWALDPGPAPDGPTLVRAFPDIEPGDGALIDDDGPLELEIALIDPTFAGFENEDSLDEPSGPLGLTVASAPSLDELPLD